MKNTVVQVLKIALAAGLIYWLVATGKITFEPFARMLSITWLVPFVFLIILCVILTNNLRWLLLLQGQKIQTGVKETLPLTFIGLFFNLAMPGSVGGDVVKAYYIAQDQPGTKVRAVTSVLMDRVVGLYAMALIALGAVTLHFSEVRASEQLSFLAFMICMVVLGFSAFFALGFSRRIRAHSIVSKIIELPGGKTFEKIYDAIHSFREGKTQFFMGIGLSVLVQVLNIFCFWVISINLGFEEMTFGALCFIVPLGLIASALPISPAGIGVGQAVFLTLFTWYQGQETTLGPTLITVFQVGLGIWGLLGAFFYFTRKAPKEINAAELS